MQLTEVNVDAALEQLAQDLDDLRTSHVQLARQGQRLGHVLGTQHGDGHALLEQAQLGALGDGVADGELDHVVGAREEGDHVVEDAGPLDVRAVLEVELLRLEVALVERTGDERHARLVLHKREVRQDVFLLVLGEVPEHHHAVREDEHLGEVLGVRRGAVHRASGKVVVAVAVAVSLRVAPAVFGHGLVQAVAVSRAALGRVVVKVPLVVVSHLAPLDF